MAAGKPTTGLDVDLPLASAIARHLSMFAEFPSTPEAVAGEAAGIARDVALRLPSPGLLPRRGHRHGSSPQRHALSQAVTLERETVVASAGLLDLLAAMPSTPPAVREEAAEAAESLWRLASDG